ncbi:TrkA C-terminal domain-containing protein [Halorarum halophilum]|uniref:TrkA C-terminal domain-containing protein n=1 Tax=Halorarum halophilum TaxID=2743090 RepID=A0A7D5GAB7_9EURY|nr:TrkA C-terminal domain-containing protein [Halobaculum halophilum]QLG26325.1 TrkA C-terminal domain-containing protein [Halobaculum halophilum]
MPPTSFPVQVLLGVYLGLLTGIIPALVAWGLGFLFKYFTGVTIPGFGVVVLALAIAGVNGGLVALVDPNIANSVNETALLVGIIVILMLSMYAHAKGDAMGASMPKRLSLRQLTDRTISTDVVELVGGKGQVRVTVSGDVADMEGYPALPADLRASIGEFSETFPAHLPLVELESLVTARLRTEFDLSDATVRLDEQGRATVAAAPPVGSVSKRVPTGKRAVSLSGLVPTGLARGDEVTVVTDGGEYRGTVVAASSSADSSGSPDAADPTLDSDAATDSGTDETTSAPTPASTSPTTTGGVGRVTVALDRADATAALGSDLRRLVVRSRGTRREFELVSLLRRAGRRFRRLTVREGSALDGRSLREATVRDEYGVAVLAVRAAGGWSVAPSGRVRPVAGDDLIVVGTYDDLSRFVEEVGA